MKSFMNLAILLAISSCSVVIPEAWSNNVILDSCKLAAATPAKSKSDDDGPSGSKTFSGNSSWYGIPFHGRKTASGEIFDMNKLSAAHLKFHLPTYCLVEDPRSGNTVIVKVNDRGPYAKGRIMDLSREAARRLGTLSRGVAYIEGTVLGTTPPAAKSAPVKE